VNIIKGWKNISKYAGWSPTQLLRMEKRGLKIHRRQVGGRNQVWVLKNEIDAFLHAWQEGQIKKEAEPPENALLKSVFSLQHLLMAVASVFLVLLFILYFTWPDNSTEEDFSFFYYAQDELKRVEDVWLSSSKHERLKTVYTIDGISNQQQGMSISKLHSRQALSPANPEHQAMYIHAFPHYSMKLNNIHTLHDENPFPHVPLPVVYSNDGEHFRDLDRIAHINWVDNAIYCGWIASVPSYSSFPCCLLFLDRDLNILARLYHPGWIFNTIIIDNRIYAVAVMNPREIESSPYQSALFSIDFLKILKMQEAQILPFSELTIPSKKKRDYYSLADISSLPPEHYLTIEPGFGWDSDISLHFGNSQELCIRWDILYLNKRLKYYILDLDLNPVQTSLIDQRLPRDIPYESVKNSMRLRKWQGLQWGPWISEEEINDRTR